MTTVDSVPTGAPPRGVPLLSVPNLVSGLRLPIAAAFFALDVPLVRGILLTLAALTDALDGWLARHFRQESRAGAFLDPLFDKLFVLIVLAAYLQGPHLGWLAFLVLISRDLYVSAGYTLLRLFGLAADTRARPTGKIVTFLQIVTLFVLLFAPSLIQVCTVAVGVASAAAAVDYTSACIADIRERSRVA